MRGVYEKVKGSKNFYIRYTDNEGRRHREHVGSESAAYETLVDRRRAIREGRFVSPLSRQRETSTPVAPQGESGITFEELFEKRIEAKQLSPGTVRQYRFQLRRIPTQLRRMPVRKIRPEDIETFLGRLRTEKISNFTIGNYRALIGCVLAHGVARDHLPGNPTLKTDAPKKPEGRVRFLSHDEEKAIRAKLRESWPLQEPEFDLLINTGLRIGELWHLTWDRVHPDRGIIEVPDEGKTGFRPIPMNSRSRAAIKMLHRQSRGSSFVVPNMYSRRGQRYPALWVGQAAEKAGVLNVSAHVLRHTFASRAVMAGVNLRQVQEWLGHKSLDMTMKYSHLEPGRGQVDVERMITFFAAAPAPKPPVRIAKPKAARLVRVAS